MESSVLTMVVKEDQEVRTLCRIISFNNIVYVYRGYEVYEVKEKTNRIITSIPESAFHGLKMARLKQFNQTDCGDHVIICEPKDLHYCLGQFLMLTRLEKIIYRTADNSHPNNRWKRERAEKRRLKK